MFTVILVMVLAAAVAIFSVQNASSVSISFLSWHFEASLAIIVFLSLLAGMVLGIAVTSWFRIKRMAAKVKKPPEAKTPEVR